jgi:S1-C subfamily serine protease
VQKGLLGIKAPNVRNPAAIEKGFNEIEGVYVSEVEEESGAYKAGIKEGDIIKAVDNVKVSKFEELTGYLASKRPGDQVRVSLERNGKRLNLPVRLKKAEYVDIDRLGLRLQNLTSKDKKLYGVNQGVKVVPSPRNRRGNYFENRVIVAINDTKLNNIQDAERVIKDLSPYESPAFTLVNPEGEKERIILRRSN